MGNQPKTGSRYYDALRTTMRQGNPFSRIARKPFKSPSFKKRHSASFFGLPEGVKAARRTNMTERLKGPKSRRFPGGSRG